MPESLMLCLDTSEWMRNGDYPPSRLAAQYDAATLVCTAVLGSNPENAVGIMAHGGKNVSLLSAPTDDEGKLLAVIGTLKANGPASFTRGLRTAMLACKNNKNKNARQRIMMFVGSPIDASIEDVTSIGAQMRKAGIGIDVVLMGENAANVERLQKLVSEANKEGNSHFYDVPVDVMPSEVLTTVLMGGDESAGAAAGGAPGAAGGAHAEFGGVDPNLDPELAMALRASLEEARAAAQASEAPAASGAPAAAAPAAAAPAASGDFGDDDELLAQALRMSMQDEAAAGAPAAAPAAGPASTASSGARAGETGVAAAGAPAAGAPAVANPDFVASVLGSIPGVDMNDPAIQAALAALGAPAPAPGSAPGGPGSNSGGSGGSSDSKRPQ